MAKTQTRTVLISSQSLSAGGTQRAAVDCTGADGGILTFRITNGGTGPSAQCEARVMVAHKQTSMPATAAEGTGDDAWKRVYAIGGGTANNGGARGVYRFGREVAYLQIEFTGNTGQAVTIEAHVTTHSE